MKKETRRKGEREVGEMKKKRDHILFKSYGLVNDKDFEEGYKDFLEGQTC